MVKQLLVTFSFLIAGASFASEPFSIDHNKMSLNVFQLSNYDCLSTPISECSKNLPISDTQYEQLLRNLIFNQKKVIVYDDEDPVDKLIPLGWCECSKAPACKRFSWITEQLLCLFEQYPNKDELLVLTSLGSGSLLQEYLIIKGLEYAGYTNIELHAIDPSFVDRRFDYTREQFESLHTRTNANIRRFKNIDQYLKMKFSKPHSIMIIDPDPASAYEMKTDFEKLEKNSPYNTLRFYYDDSRCFNDGPGFARVKRGDTIIFK